MLQLVSHHVIDKSLVQSSRVVGLPVHHILAGNVITCLELTELSMLFQDLGLCIVTLERNVLRPRSNCN